MSLRSRNPGTSMCTALDKVAPTFTNGDGWIIIIIIIVILTYMLVGVQPLTFLLILML